MDQNNLLGIYIKKDLAIITLTDSHANSAKHYSVSIEEADEKNNEAIAETVGSLIYQKIGNLQKNLTYAGLAVDCSFFTQHRVHSQFSDEKQIAQTVKFDAEEALATDILEKAITFDINRMTQNGSDVTIYAGQRSDFTKMLSDLQTNKINPVTMEPDVCCLVRFFNSKLKKRKDDLKNCIVVVLSNDRCYLISYDDIKHRPETRTFLTNINEDKTKLLQRQIPLSIASFSKELGNNHIFIADTTKSVDLESLNSRLGVDVEAINLEEMLPAVIEGEIGPVDAAISAGSVIGGISKQNIADFREDFSPYLGRKKAVEKTLKFMSIFVSILLLAIGVYFQTEVIQKNNQIKKAEEKLFEEASLIISKNTLKKGKEPIPKRLKSEINKLNQQKSGQLTLESGSIEGKLNFVLEAINRVDKAVDIDIETIDVSQRSMRLIGSTNSSQSTLKLFEEIKKHSEIVIDERSSKTSGGRNKFRVTMRPKKQ